LNKINSHADGLLKDLEDERPDPGEAEDPIDPGFRWSFWENIKGNAFAFVSLLIFLDESLLILSFSYGCTGAKVSTMSNL
jgi:hypothetical protein